MLGWRSSSRDPVATRNVDVSPEPANIVAALSLAPGTRYAIQNVDPNARIFVREAAVKPTGGALRGFVVAPFETGTFQPEPGIGLWLWTDRADGAKAVIGEAP